MEFSHPRKRNMVFLKTKNSGVCVYGDDTQHIETIDYDWISTFH